LALAATVSACTAHLLRLPAILTHIIAGIVIGPHLLGFVSDEGVIRHLGEFGVILLLFFIGMEISLRHIASHWRIILLATLVHSALVVSAVLAFGVLLDWPVGRSVLLGMVISLSSTAVLLRYLEARDLLRTKLGHEVSGILIMQDIMVIPMLLIVSLFGAGRGADTMIMQTAASVVLVAVLVGLTYLTIHASRRTRIARRIGEIVQDAEAGLLVGISLCFGFAFLTSALSLSPGLGAFIAGLIYAGLNMPEKVRKRIVPFKIFFLALFFMSIGLLVNISFLLDSFLVVLFMVFLVFGLNTLVRMLYFRIMGASWRYALHAASLLAHVGEFGFFIASAGYAAGMISAYAYELTVIMVAVSILLSPLWIRAFSRFAPEKDL